MEFSAQMARDWNPAWRRLRTRASAQRCWMKRRVARAVMVRLPGAAGVRNWTRSFRRTLFPKDGPVAGVAVQQRGVAPAEEERMEFWKEGPGGGEVELHAGFLTLTHRNDRRCC